MIAILLLGIVPLEIIPTAEVDQVWENQCYSPETGDPACYQMVYWRWYGEGHRADGFTTTDVKGGMDYDHYRKRWYRFHVNNGLIRKVTTKCFIVSPTVGDPEVDDREKLPTEHRVGLLYWPPLEGRLHVPRHP